ncbi:MAG: hypothetical protein BGO29_13970 [Bacteroidales bacterium 36-12]|jgi:peptidoglycan/xylan/chitin deacetylase (PgdA/CDA1 family)|nr:MAG: hypothetical protein BGO29_13970 [Bacteroidales bacterium 36-12]
MHPVLYDIFRKSSALVPLSILIRITGQGLVLPLYHVISDNPLKHIKHLYKVLDSKTFEKDIDFLLKNYEVVTPEYLIKCAENPELRKNKAFLITFDDGLREFYEVAAPILKRKGVPAICFLNSDFVDNKDLFYRLKVSLLIEEINKVEPSNSAFIKIRSAFEAYGLIYRGASDLLKIKFINKKLLDKVAEIISFDFQSFLKNTQPYMNLSEIKELEKQGFYFGAHSVNHPEFRFIDSTEQQFQINESLKFVQNNLHPQSNFFAFPFTDYGLDKSFFESIKPQVDISFGTANLKLDDIPSNFQRIPMEIPNRSDAQTILKTEYLIFYAKKIFGLERIKR